MQSKSFKIDNNMQKNENIRHFQTLHSFFSPYMRLVNMEFKFLNLIRAQAWCAFEKICVSVQSHIAVHFLHYHDIKINSKLSEYLNFYQILKLWKKLFKVIIIILFFVKIRQNFQPHWLDEVILWYNRFKLTDWMSYF